jgi:FKBP-type peptidyl-prolyl cis-trans isomerase
VIVGDPVVAKGYSMGVVGMCVGEKRVIVTPANLAYGAKGMYPAIPPHTPIEWHTELMRIIPDDEDF